MSPDLVTLESPDSAPVENDSAPSPAITMSDVKPRPLEWLWPGWLALGKLAVLDGDPEQGKGFVLLDLASRLSRGALMPDCCDTCGETENGRNGESESGGNRDTETGRKGESEPPLFPVSPVRRFSVSGVDVTMLIAKDSLEDTLFPRLQAAGANLSRIHILKSNRRVGQTHLSVRVPRDVPLVEEIIQTTHSRLLVIEPNLADLDRHCLCLLADLADRLRCAVVLQRYLSKWAATRAIGRGIGGMGVMGAARTAMLVARDPREEAVRILASTKNNFGPRPGSLRFVLEPISPGVCRVSWLGPSPLLADDLLAVQAAVEGKTAIAQAMKFLKEFLKDGPKATEMCYDEGRKNQISAITLRRAKSRLGVATNQEHSLLGLFIPATWELSNGKDSPPHSLINGSTDE